MRTSMPLTAMPANPSFYHAGWRLNPPRLTTPNTPTKSLTAKPDW